MARSALKVTTIIGTRPEIIRLSEIIKLLDLTVDHELVHTGQNSDYSLNQVFFEDLGLRAPDLFLGVRTESLGTVLADTLIGIERYFNTRKPDAVLILGDTNSAISALMAKRMNIPVYHMEAGNRSFDENVPEEINRRFVDHIADFNLPYNDFSLRNLLDEGLHPRRLMKSGSPLKEVVAKHIEKVASSDVLDRLALSEGVYFIASFHRQENVDYPDRLASLVQALSDLGSQHDMPVIVSTHPRTKGRLEQSKIRANQSNVHFMQPMGFIDYLALQKRSFCAISDSGTISEESAILNFPAVTIRESMERPEALEVGSITMSGLTSDGLADAVSWAVSRHSRDMPMGYEVENTSERVVNFIISTVRLHKIWLNLH